MRAIYERNHINAIEKVMSRITLTLKNPVSFEKKAELEKLCIPVKSKYPPQKKIKKVKEKTEKDIFYETLFKNFDWLSNKYPKCFNLKNKKPLKQGIRKDLWDDFPKDGSMDFKDIITAINFYTSHISYLGCFQTHDKRYDLEGNECETISNKDKDWALMNYNRVLKIVEKKLEEKKKKKDDCARKYAQKNM